MHLPIDVHEIGCGRHSAVRSCPTGLGVAGWGTARPIISMQRQLVADFGSLLPRTHTRWPIMGPSLMSCRLWVMCAYVQVSGYAEGGQALVEPMAPGVSRYGKTHTCTPIEPIPLTATVGSDLGKRRSARRLPAFS
jgi:hypothetical protein